MNEKTLLYIWLSSTLRPGSKAHKILLEHFGTIEKVYSAEKQDYAPLALASGEIVALCNKNLDTAKRYMDFCVKNKIGILCYEDPYFPERLKIIENPPAMFYYKGRLINFDDYPCITMVGTRSCSERGFRLAYTSGYDAASKGAVIVNGLALGIDGACIAGALDANGYAVGLLGCGIDRVYPSGNRDLFERLCASGLILSEFSPFSEPAGANFPVRNRVMSALSVATVVFEAGDGSGAMITASHALQQGRRIFAVPGKPYDKSYAGPLELIKDGASIFTEADDVLTEYSMNFPHRINLANINEVPKDKLDAYVARYFKKDTDPDEPVNRRYGMKKPTHQTPDEPSAASYLPKQEKKPVPKPIPEQNKNVEKTIEESNSVQVDLSVLSVTEKHIYTFLSESGSLSPDELSEKGLKIDDILSALTLLEIYGLIRAIPGGKYEIIK